MDFLRINGNRFVDESNNTVVLRGVNIGGWMNMEDFINCYPGSESGTRKAMAAAIGKQKADFFFNRMLDYIFAEEDAAFLSSLGFNALRLPLNYRHFEKDSEPFVYLEEGFRRLDAALALCEKYGLYAILDLHAVQGWQNTDWHCDNPGRHSLLWSHGQFQERFTRLWQAIAERYASRPVVAMYDLMNEPIVNARYGRFSSHYQPNWEVFNRVNKAGVEAIRQVDAKHIILLEGDNFSNEFAGMEAPFADNLAYSSHNYISSGIFGKYPGLAGDVYWDNAKQREVFYNAEGTQFAQKHGVPLVISEFGSVYNGPKDEIPDRLRSLDDQLALFNEFGASWTIWTYKDPGVMSLASLNPESEFIQVLQPVIRKKDLLNSHFGVNWLPENKSKKMCNELADYMEQIIGMEHVDTAANRKYLAQSVFSEFGAIQLQPAYAQCFKGMTEERIDEVLSSFALSKCIQNTEHIAILQKHAAKGSQK